MERASAGQRLRPASLATEKQKNVILRRETTKNLVFRFFTIVQNDKEAAFRMTNGGAQKDKGARLRPGQSGDCHSLALFSAKSAAKTLRPMSPTTVGRQFAATFRLSKSRAGRSFRPAEARASRVHSASSTPPTRQKFNPQNAREGALQKKGLRLFRQRPARPQGQKYLSSETTGCKAHDRKSDFHLAPRPVGAIGSSASSAPGAGRGFRSAAVPLWSGQARVRAQPPFCG